MRRLIVGTATLVIGVTGGGLVGWLVELLTRAAGWTLVLALAGLIAATLYLALGAPEEPATAPASEEPAAPETRPAEPRPEPPPLERT